MYPIKCPICGNAEFVIVKEKTDPIFRYSKGEKTTILGCTECGLLLTFNKVAVEYAANTEDRANRIRHEIEELNKCLANERGDTQESRDYIKRLEQEKRVLEEGFED